MTDDQVAAVAIFSIIASLGAALIVFGTTQSVLASAGSALLAFPLFLAFFAKIRG